MNRITINTNICHGQPSIRNMRFTVAQLLELVAAGMTPDEILADYPYLEQEDIAASLRYAALTLSHKDMLSFGKVA
ncbi:hypothetical protein AGMMS4956_00010 [Bacteroidia bacterium]|nr:hypothetical protein AGMMS4956_00010 [Bacteroidia bacterium]